MNESNRLSKVIKEKYSRLDEPVETARKLAYRWGEKRSFEPEYEMVGTIPTTIVNTHSHVLPFWDRQNPFTLVRFDCHKDMGSGSRAAPELPFSLAYAQSVSESAFNSVAAHYGLIKGIYSFDLRNLFAVFYDKEQLRTKITSDGHIEWVDQEPIGQPLSYQKAIEDISRAKTIFTDYDLDVFECVIDSNSSAYWNPERTIKEIYQTAEIVLDQSHNAIDTALIPYINVPEAPEVRRNIPWDMVSWRMNKARGIVEQLSKPIGISIAHSTAGHVWTPLNTVKAIEWHWLKILREIYTKQ